MEYSPVDFKSVVAALLQKRARAEAGDSDLIPSAVLMPIYEKDGRLHLLFTKRTERVAHHKGQISFPGGARDPGDRSLLDTALRESSEEIGLDPSTVEVLGALDDTPTVASNYVITPYVGFLSAPPALELSREEVDRVIELPLEALLNHRKPAHERMEEAGVIREVPGYRCSGHFIWGATARLVTQFLDVVRPEMERAGTAMPAANCHS